MTIHKRFWVVLLLFQVVFGIAVFAVTRAYYLEKADQTELARSLPEGSAPEEFIQGLVLSDAVRLSSLQLPAPDGQDPVSMLQRADELFGAKQYEQAAVLYARALALLPNDANINNNLGLTLHYLGQSEEALRVLHDGVVKDDTNQRIWLTLGFVSSQTGNTPQAREALTRATQIGNDESIRKSALAMLDELP